ncbi:MAG TPA: hypothetical protein VFI65_18035 [Streptosporangiaceae bacterium]|nr:hypothetical protein [Streptosporangiaceae bacterium]
MTAPTRPGLDPRRMVRLAGEAVQRCRLDLSGRIVLTEAATGAYAVTALLAALAGAQVYALAEMTRYASTAELRATLIELAELAGVTSRIEILPGKSLDVIGRADIVTNSGQVRPIDAGMVASLKPSCVIPLMYESWEFRDSDLDLAACRLRGIPVAGTNETHPAVDVFAFLGPMAVKQLHDAGIAVYGSRIAVLCDNPFEPFIVSYLQAAGARAAAEAKLTSEFLSSGWDAVLLALRPGAADVVTVADADLLGRHAPGTPLIQFWGDVDRRALASANVPVWPLDSPGRGHMGVLPSAVGPEPVVRLQAGGLKVGELLASGLATASPEDRDLVQLL